MSSPHSSSISLSTLNPLMRRPALGAQSSRPGSKSAVGDSAPPWKTISQSPSKPIIALCHLSWDWVWQRPQQFLSRLAKTHPVLFVETYCSDVPATTVSVRTAEGYPSVTLCAMHLPASRWNDGKFIDRERRRALRQTLSTDL